MKANKEEFKALAVLKAVPLRQVPHSVGTKLRAELNARETQHIICRDNEPSQ